jgi:hypothetical protein
MTHHRYFRIVKAACLVLATLAMTTTTTIAQEAAAGASSLYVETTGAISSNAPALVAVPGLSLTLPPASRSAKFALITLNMPNLFLTGGTPGQTLGSVVALSVNGTLVAVGQASGDVVVGAAGAMNDGRKPVDVVVKVPLGTTSGSLTAVWGGARNTIVNSDTFASMSVLLLSN